MCKVGLHDALLPHEKHEQPDPHNPEQTFYIFSKMEEEVKFVSNVVNGANGNGQRPNQAGNVNISAEARRRRAAQSRRDKRMAAARVGPQPRGRFSQEALERYSLLSILSDAMLSYCEAVIHPFGDGAIGAVCPDNWVTPSIPVTDRLSIDLDPQPWITALANVSAPRIPTTLAGFVIAAIPRCQRAGYLAADGPDLAGAYAFINGDYIGFSDELSGTSDQSVILNHYWLLISAIGADGQFWYLNPDDGDGIAEDGYNALQFSRFSQYRDCCDKGRLLGMGLKVWSDQSPLNTGGRVYGGWITQEDIQLIGKVGAGVAPTFQNKLREWIVAPGVKGVTVRYSPLQDPIQENYVYPSIPSNQYTLQPFDDVGPSPVEEKNCDVSSGDQCAPGSYIPCAVWKYNTTTSGDGPYTITINAISHVQGSPNGDCPFVMQRVKADPMYAHISTILEDVDTFPITATGHSFKSFMSKAKKIVSKGAKIAGKTTKLLQLLDKFAAE